MGSNTETVGERVRRLRRERGLTQRDLAGDGVSYSYISRLETGERVPSLRVLRRIAERLGVSAELLETGVEPLASEAELLDAELELRMGSPAEARQAFIAARTTADATGDEALAVRARLGLGLAAAALGENAIAIAELEDALGRSRPTVAERPDVFAALGRCYSVSGQSVRAIALLEECVEEIRAAEIVDGALYVRFATYLGYALMDTGDLSGANRLLADALGYADRVDDVYTEIRLYWSLGRLYSVQGPPELATSYARKAVALLELTEDRLHLGSAHEACATSLLDQHEPGQALEHLDAADAIYQELDQGALLASLNVQRARFHLQAGDAGEARRFALDALDRLESGIADPDNVGDAWRVLGETLAAIGEAELAEPAFLRAIEHLSDDGAPVKSLADAYRSYADLLEAEGRTTEALAAMRSSARSTSPAAPRSSAGGS